MTKCFKIICSRAWWSHNKLAKRCHWSNDLTRCLIVSFFPLICYIYYCRPYINSSFIAIVWIMFVKLGGNCPLWRPRRRSIHVLTYLHFKFYKFRKYYFSLYANQLHYYNSFYGDAWKLCIRISSFGNRMPTIKGQK